MRLDNCYVSTREISLRYIILGLYFHLIVGFCFSHYKKSKKIHYTHEMTNNYFIIITLFNFARNYEEMYEVDINIPKEQKIL